MPRSQVCRSNPDCNPSDSSVSSESVAFTSRPCCHRWRTRRGPRASGESPGARRTEPRLPQRCWRRRREIICLWGPHREAKRLSTGTLINDHFLSAGYSTRGDGFPQPGPHTEEVPSIELTTSSEISSSPVVSSRQPCLHRWAASVASPPPARSNCPRPPRPPPHQTPRPSWRPHAPRSSSAPF